MSTPNACCDDPHHSHASGADLVAPLGRGYATNTIILVVLTLVTPLCAATTTHADALPVFYGLALGLVLSALSFILGALMTRTPRAALALTGAGAVVQEVLRMVAVALAGAYASPWVAAGAVMVQFVVAAAGEARARNLILKPGDWARAQIQFVLDSGMTAARAGWERLGAYVCAALWTWGATLMMARTWVMVLPLIVLAFGCGLIGLLLARKDPRGRATSPLRFVTPAVSVLILLAGILLAR